MQSQALQNYGQALHRSRELGRGDHMKIASIVSILDERMGRVRLSTQQQQIRQESGFQNDAVNARTAEPTPGRLIRKRAMSREKRAVLARLVVDLYRRHQSGAGAAKQEKNRECVQ